MGVQDSDQGIFSKISEVKENERRRRRKGRTPRPQRMPQVEKPKRNWLNTVVPIAPDHCSYFIPSHNTPVSVKFSLSSLPKTAGKQDLSAHIPVLPSISFQQNSATTDSGLENPGFPAIEDYFQ